MTRRISASEFKKSGIVNNKKQASEEVVQADEKRTLPYWMEKLQKVLSHHQAERQQMDGRERLYRGTKQIDGRLPGTVARKPATVTRNIVFELIESQIDANIPQPKVSALCADCEEKALAVENFLKAELQRLPMERLNDEQERTVPLQGGSWFLLEWDSKAPEGQALCVSILHPKDVLVQPGVVEIDEADYVFVLRRRTREQLFRQYGVWVAESNALKSYEGGQTDMITHVTVYYKDNSGRIGLFAFAGDEVLQDLPDYFARRDENGEPVDEESVLLDRQTQNGVITRGTVLPYYRIKGYPLVLRKNVSVWGQLLGDSDADKIRDQQMLINKLGTKIEEKLLKGGSFVTLPRNVGVRRDDEELKVIELYSPTEAQMIQTINLQPNIALDAAEKERAYLEAKSTLGVTDSFQGKPDATAQSGRAKEIQVQQSAGRLESKRRMKNAAYADLFQKMFWFMLAFCDEPYPIPIQDGHGQKAFLTASRYDFLTKGPDGAWQYNDRFLFRTDAAGSLGQNREAMWQETRLNFTQGAFGPLAEKSTLLLFWDVMESLHYPKAHEVKQALESITEESNGIDEKGL